MARGVRRSKAEADDSLLVSAASRYAESISFGEYVGQRIKLGEVNRGFCTLNDNGEIDFNYHEGQTKVMSSLKRFIIALAGRQGGKCLRVTESVTMANGEQKPVGHIEEGEVVMSLNPKTLKIGYARVSHKWKTGTKPVYRLTSGCGAEIVATAEHKFLVAEGQLRVWKELKELSPGDFIASPRSVPCATMREYDHSLLRVMGYLLGDGGTTQSTPKFTNKDTEVIEDLRLNIPKGNSLIRGSSKYEYLIVGHKFVSPVLHLIREWCIDKKAIHKTIPEFVFGLTNECIANVLNPLFACDGWVDGKGVGICLASKEMVYQIRHLLLRFGILSRIRYKPVKLGGKVFDSWHLQINDLESLMRFASQVGIVSKQDKLLRLIERKSLSSRSWNCKDFSPDFPRADCLLPERGHKQPHSDQEGYGLLRKSRKGIVSRRSAQMFADHFEVGVSEAYSDIYWDTVESIEYVGKEETCDIEVMGNHNFVCQELIVHNSEIGPPWLHDEMIARGPGWYMVVAPSFPILEDSALPKILTLFEQYLRLGYLRHNPLRFIISPEGERYLFGHEQSTQTIIRFGHGSDPASLEAKTAKACWVDEGGQDGFKAESYEAIEGRLTTTLGRLLVTTTPYNLGVLKTKFFDPWERLNGDHPEIDIIQWKSTANPRFSKDEYERLKKTMPAWRHAMFYDGVFSVPSGLIYGIAKEREETMRVPRFIIPSHWPRFGGIDFGGVNTCAGLATLTPEPVSLPNGNTIPANALVLYKTYHPGLARRITTHAHEILKGEPFIDRWVGGAKSEGQWRDEFWENGINIEEPPITDVHVGIQRAYSMIAANRYYAMEDLEQFWNELYTYRYKTDPNTGEVLPEMEIVNKEAYHHMDSCLRYLCSIFGELAQNFIAHGGGERALVSTYGALQEGITGVGRPVDREGRVVEGQLIRSGKTRFNQRSIPGLLGVNDPSSIFKRGLFR